MCDSRLFHDFPRLAKESGYYFNYRSKRIDWSEIEKINLEDIAKHKRFEVLEEKLEFVIDCELDDGITKVLDCNFVKLFRLAQLSVGYLRHCQFYLDRCVILLQEQLTAALKCIECEKSFMSASYLESHQRRRHSSPTTSGKFVSIAVQTDQEVETVTIKKNAEQQTTEVKTVSLECQTPEVKTFDIGLMTNLENQHQETNDIMEKFEGLYQRMDLIEKQTSCQKEQSSSDLSTFLQNLLPGFQQSTPSKRINQGYLKMPVNTKSGEFQETQQPLIDFNNEPDLKEIPFEKEGVKEANLNNFYEESSPSQEIPQPRLDQNSSSNTFISGTQPTVPLTRVRKKINMSMNNDDKPVPIPRPRPRKSTISRQKSLLIDFDDTDSDVQKSSQPVINENDMEERRQSINDSVVLKEKLEERRQNIEISTPVISLLSLEENTIDKITENIKKDTENFIKNDELKPKHKSLFKTFVKKSSPKFKGFRNTIKKSWSNFSDSKLFNTDNMLIRPSTLNKNEKLEEERDDDSISDEIMLTEKEGKQKEKKFENKLRELGVDPEWSGIPVDSYTRIKAVLDQRSQLIAKKNPDYLRRRNRLESLIMQRIKKSNQDYSTGIDNIRPIVESEETKMYDLESDTESEANNSPYLIEKPRNLTSLSLNSFPSFLSNEKSSDPTNNDKSTTIVEIQTGIAESDSSDISEIEKEIKPSTTLKSSILNKGKDEIKKKVVFADNFEIETTHDLMKTPNSSNSSTSSSDWDIPMP